MNPQINIHNKTSHESWAKMVNDFMTDIMGAIIPGVLFISGIIICLGIPLVILYGRSLVNENNISAAVSFGMILLLLILSYAIGVVFYRSDINVPDNRSIRRKINEHIKNVLNEGDKFTRLVEIDDDIERRVEICGFESSEGYEYLLPFIQLAKEDKPVDENSFVKSFAYIKQKLNSEDSKRDVLTLIDLANDCLEIAFNKNLQNQLDKQNKADNDLRLDKIIPWLQVFFNEIKHIDFCDNYNEFKAVLHFIQCKKYIDPLGDSSFEILLSEYYSSVLAASGVKYYMVEDYRKLIEKEPVYNDRIAKENNSILEKLIIYTCIRRMQNEEGTPCPDSGGFPYINYENYLIKRGFHSLAEQVVWNNREGRTKNQINRYKIKLNVFTPEVCTIINKNESHVRMASSSWYAARGMIKSNRLIACFLYFLMLPKLLEVSCLLNLIPVGLITALTVVGLSRDTVDKWIDPAIGLLIVAAALFVVCKDFYPQLFLPLFPISINFLLTPMRTKIEDNLHYQRVREIYFTMYTYSQCKGKMEYIERGWKNAQ